MIIGLVKKFPTLEMGSGALIYIPGFIRISSAIGDTHTGTDSKISHKPPIFFKIT
jgi:hypothetical protein